MRREMLPVHFSSRGSSALGSSGSSMRHEVKIAVRAAMVVMLAFYHSPVHAQEGVKVPVSVLERYVGEWVYPAGNSVKVVLRDNALFREAGGQLIPLVALSETRFTAGPVFT